MRGDVTLHEHSEPSSVCKRRDLNSGQEKLAADGPLPTTLPHLVIGVHQLQDGAFWGTPLLPRDSSDGRHVFFLRYFFLSR